MTTLFNYDKIHKVNVKLGQFIKIKGGMYDGDLAQVLAVEDPIKRIIVKVIPRFKGEGQRPKQKLFNPAHYSDAVSKPASKNVRSEADIEYHWNKQTFVNGLVIKRLTSKAIQTADVVPTIEEMKIFKAKNSNEPEELDNFFEDSIKRRKVLRKNDKVRILEGQLANVLGTVESVEGNKVNLIAHVEGLDDILQFDISMVEKKFMPGDKVGVVSGNHKGKTGIIVRFNKNDAIIYSDNLQSEFSVSTSAIVDIADFRGIENAADEFNNFDLVRYGTLLYNKESGSHLFHSEHELEDN